MSEANGNREKRKREGRAKQAQKRSGKQTDRQQRKRKENKQTTIESIRTRESGKRVEREPQRQREGAKHYIGRRGRASHRRRVHEALQPPNDCEKIPPRLPLFTVPSKAGGEAIKAAYMFT